MNAQAAAPQKVGGFQVSHTSPIIYNWCFQRKQSSAASMMKQKDLEELMVVLKAESEPMWFTNMYVESPCKPCCACYCILILLAAVSLMGGLLEPTLGGEKGRDYGVTSSVEQKSWDRVILGNEYMKETSTDVFA